MHGKKILGVEFGSTRIKSVLIDDKGGILASGSYNWSDKLVDGFWSYELEEAETGLQKSFSELNENFKKSYGEYLTEIDAIGISGMMHGYLPFDKNGILLAPFRTWRNAKTEAAAKELSEKLSFNMPQRWSAVYFYDAVVKQEKHVKDVAFLTTLAGYFHYRITGEKVLGANDASGMFPLNNGDYDADKLKIYDELLRSHGLIVNIKTLLPKVLSAGQPAGILTEEGAHLIDPSGRLKPGAKACPPEGDMGTGMVATDSVAPKTGNFSAGTSGNLTVILERLPKKYHEELDVIASPDGLPAAIIHVASFTSDINFWLKLLRESAELFGAKVSDKELFDKLFTLSDSSVNASAVVPYGFLTGEVIIGLSDGLPMLIRKKGENVSLADFVKALIYATLAPLKVGMKILTDEGVKVDCITGHGGFFKTEGVGARAASAAMGASVKTLSTSGEGGAWGIALLALYTLKNDRPLSAFLEDIFSDTSGKTFTADEREKAAFNAFCDEYYKYLKINEKAALLV